VAHLVHYDAGVLAQRVEQRGEGAPQRVRREPVRERRQVPFG
jgi:hypothetical protein